MYVKFIHVITSISRFIFFFLLLSSILIYGCATFFFLIHSQIEEHLGCFQFFMIVNKAHTKFMYGFLCEYIFFCLLDKYLGMELLGCMVNVYLPLQKSSQSICVLANGPYGFD